MTLRIGGLPKRVLSPVIEEPGMKHGRALSVVAAAAVLLALSAVRFSPADAIPITGLVAAGGGLLALARRRWRS
jgi:ABC-type iron transport system FetAB permease component